MKVDYLKSILIDEENSTQLIGWTTSSRVVKQTELFANKLGLNSTLSQFV